MTKIRMAETEGFEDLKIRISVIVSYFSTGRLTADISISYLRPFGHSAKKTRLYNWLNMHK